MGRERRGVRFSLCECHKLSTICTLALVYLSKLTQVTFGAWAKLVCRYASLICSLLCLAARRGGICRLCRCNVSNRLRRRRCGGRGGLRRRRERNTDAAWLRARVQAASAARFRARGVVANEEKDQRRRRGRCVPRRGSSTKAVERGAGAERCSSRPSADGDLRCVRRYI